MSQENFAQKSDPYPCRMPYTAGVDQSPSKPSDNEAPTPSLDLGTITTRLLEEVEEELMSTAPTRDESGACLVSFDHRSSFQTSQSVVDYHNKSKGHLPGTIRKVIETSHLELSAY